jgi:hypothetical protein
MRMFGKCVEFALKSEHQKMPVTGVDLPKVVDPRAAAFVLHPLLDLCSQIPPMRKQHEICEMR